MVWQDFEDEEAPTGSSKQAFNDWTSGSLGGQNVKDTPSGVCEGDGLGRRALSSKTRE